MKNALRILLLVLIISACKKDEIIVAVDAKQTSTEFDLHGIHFYDSQHGYVCGGSKYESGVWLKTNDGGMSWCCEDMVYGKCAYGINFKNASHGIIYGFDGFIAESWNGGIDFSIRNIPGWLPVNKMIQLSGSRWVMSYGANYNLGGLLTTPDGGNNWINKDLATDMQSVHSLNNRDVIGCGYGHVLFSSDSGTSWSSSSVQGDFFTDIQFINSNMAIACGYQGSIIRTENKGENWYTVKSGNHPFETRDHFEALHFFDEYHGISCGPEGCVYITNDRGVTWQNIKKFTTDRLRDVWMLTANSAIVVGEKGRVYRINWQ